MEDFDIFSAHSKCLHRLYFGIVFCAMYLFWSHVYQKPCQRHNGPLCKGSSQQNTHINKLQRSWLSALAKQVAACDLNTKSFRQANAKLLAASNLLSTLSSTLISATAITSSFDWWIKSQKQELVTDKARQSSDSGPIKTWPSCRHSCKRRKN